MTSSSSAILAISPPFAFYDDFILGTI